jgi:hypothetical protein
MYFKKVKPYLLIVASSLLLLTPLLSRTLRHADPKWGFWSHRYINRMAVYRLPPELLVFYKEHIDFLSENAVNPDKRRYAVVGEAEKHFIDLDSYADSVTLPIIWSEAVQKFGEDSLRKHGIAPWNLQHVALQLTEAFRQKDKNRILKLSADLGHYVGDIHVPLHTTKNYNGQLTGQEGIHAFWESRLPELLANDYEFWIGPIEYIENMAENIWNAVNLSHAACDSVLRFERELSNQWKSTGKYSYEVRLNQNVKVYSEEFSKAYHALLDGQVERQMRGAIRMTGNIWYTCWINAGQPNMNSLIEKEETENNSSQEDDFRWLKKIFKIRSEIDDH